MQPLLGARLKCDRLCSARLLAFGQDYLCIFQGDRKLHLVGASPTSVHPWKEIERASPDLADSRMGAAGVTGSRAVSGDAQPLRDALGTIRPPSPVAMRS